MSKMNLTILHGDITTFTPPEGRVGAIVNAANITLLGGGGVDGSIHKAAGSGLRVECEKLPLLQGNTRCMTGCARLTGAGNLPVSYVIHAVGPIFPSQSSRIPKYPGEFTCQTEEEATSILRTAINTCFTLALAKGVTHLAFPAISCGVFGCPIPTFALALHETMTAIEKDGHTLPDTSIYLFQTHEYDAFQNAWTWVTGKYEHQWRVAEDGEGWFCECCEMFIRGLEKPSIEGCPYKDLPPEE